MIVTCERCATQFQLDDERVPEDGVRVRCSRCKHAFFIERPPRNEAEKIHRIARRALEDAPAPSADLAGGKDGDALDEEDWQFADDVPFGSEAEEDPNALTAAAATHVVDDLLGGVGTGDEGYSVVDLIGDDGMPTRSEPFALADEEAALPVAASDVAPLEPELGELDSDLDLADLGGDPRDAADDSTSLLADLRGELGGDEPLDVDPGLPLLETDAPAPSEGVTSPTRQIVIPQESDELGALADWGLADDTDSLTTSTGLEVPTRATARVPTELEDEPSPRAIWFARIGNLAGWVCVVALFAFGLHSGVTLNAAPEASASVSAVRVGGFALSHVDTTWIDNFHVGPLLVVSGTLRNESARRGTGVQARLLGLDGQPIEDATMAVGPALDDALLRSSHPDLLAEAQHGLRQGGWPWNPGEERRFVAVAPGVPVAAMWVRFEARTQALPVPSPEPLPDPLSAAPIPETSRDSAPPASPSPQPASI